MAEPEEQLKPLPNDIQLGSLYQTLRALWVMLMPAQPSSNERSDKCIYKLHYRSPTQAELTNIQDKTTVFIEWRHQAWWLYLYDTITNIQAAHCLTYLNQFIPQTGALWGIRPETKRLQAIADRYTGQHTNDSPF